MKRVRFTYEYAPGPGPVIFSVIVGNGQVGGSAVTIDGAELAEPGQIDELPIGDGGALRGREMLVRTGVLDVNAQSDQTSVTYLLAPQALSRRRESRPEPPLEPLRPPMPEPGRTFTATVAVEHDGDAVLYDTRIRFV